MPYSDHSNASDYDVDSDTFKRECYNDRQRKRRDILKERFASLRKKIPALRDCKQRPSRELILTETSKYIDKKLKRIRHHQEETDLLKQQMELVDEQIRILEEDDSPENRAAAAKVLEATQMITRKIRSQQSNRMLSDSKDSSESLDSSEMDESSAVPTKDVPRKILKPKYRFS